MKSKQEILSVTPFSKHVNIGSAEVHLTKCVYIEESINHIDFWSLNPIILDDLHRSRGLRLINTNFRPFSAKKVYILTVPKSLITY